MLQRRRSLLVAGSLLLLLLALWFGPREPAQESRKSRTSDPRGKPQERAEKNEVASRTRSKRNLSKDVRDKTHEVNDLKDFYHPPILLENVTLEEGLHRLAETYRTICQHTGETALPLNWKVRGSPEMIRSLKLEGRFLDSCRWLALHARMTCELREGVLVFSEVAPGPKKHRKWKVPPTFVNLLAELTGNDRLSPRVAQTDPFTAEIPDDLPDLPLPEDATITKDEPPELTAILQKIGILTQGETVTMDAATSELVVTAETGTMELIDSLVDMSLASTPVQILYELAHEVDGNSMTLPKIVAFPGQEATIEMGREYAEVQGDGMLTAFVGVKVRMTGELYGFGERTALSYERTDPPSDQEVAAYQQSGRLDDLNLEGIEIGGVNFLKTVDARRENSPTEVSPGTGPSRTRLHFTSQRIDATGTPIPGP